MASIRIRKGTIHSVPMKLSPVRQGRSLLFRYEPGHPKYKAPNPHAIRGHLLHKWAR